MTTPDTSARERALDRLMRIEHEGAFVSRTTGDDLEPDSARAERQSAEYVAGVTRQRRWLDFLIDQFYRGKESQLEPTLRQILRLGLYELLVLDTPSHAAVNEAVELAKRRVRPQAARLVNGVLRSVDRQRSELPEPATGNRITDLAIRYSLPDWIVGRWVEQFGEEEAGALAEAANARPVYGIRINTSRYTRDSFGELLDEMGVEWHPSPYLDDFVRVGRIQPILRVGLLEDGTCAVQDEAAGLIVRLLDPQPGDHVIDAAAAPGGKAIYCAMRMMNEGSVLAIDVNAARLELAHRAAEGHGVAILDTLTADLRDLARSTSPPRAQRVLLDAPCSGLGVLSKRADLRWHRTEGDVHELCALQDDLLDAAAQLVEPGGLLVYSTCTIDPAENEERVEAFLDRHSNFSIERGEPFVPSEMVTSRGCFLALPHRYGIDGAFGVRLRRAGE